MTITICESLREIGEMACVTTAWSSRGQTLKNNLVSTLCLTQCSPPPPPPFEKTLQCTIGFTHGKYAPEGPEGPTFNSSGQTISSHNFNRMVLIKSFFKICCRTHIMAVEKTVLERIVGVMKSSFSEFAITIREHLQVISQLSRLLTTSSVTHSSPVRLREVSASFSSISILPVK